MDIFNSAVPATGGWYKVEVGGDFSVSCLDSDNLDGGTLYIDVADTAKLLLKGSTDRAVTAVLAPTVITLSYGYHIRARLAGSGASADVNVSAQSVSSETEGLVISP